MSCFLRWKSLIVSPSLWPSCLRAPKFRFRGCRLLGSFVCIRGKRSLTGFGCSFKSRLAQHDSSSCVQQQQFHVCCQRDPSRAAQILGRSHYPNTWHTSVGPITWLTGTQWVECRLLNRGLHHWLKPAGNALIVELNVVRIQYWMFASISLSDTLEPVHFWSPKVRYSNHLVKCVKGPGCP